VVAATLGLGFWAGRVTGPASDAANLASGSARTAAPLPAQEPVADAGALPFRLAALQHLDSAAALLSALPENARSGRTAEVASWARDLLATTRLLRDSPASEDAQLAALFRDLELVLAQIASLDAAVADDEIELIREGIRENDVLLRVRAATERRPTAGI
jgi:hypothetical protein